MQVLRKSHSKRSLWACFWETFGRVWGGLWTPGDDFFKKRDGRRGNGKFHRFWDRFWSRIPPKFLGPAAGGGWLEASFRPFHHRSRTLDSNTADRGRPDRERLRRDTGRPQLLFIAWGLKGFRVAVSSIFIVLGYHLGYFLVSFGQLWGSQGGPGTPLGRLGDRS